MQTSNLIREGARLLTIAAIGLTIGGSMQHPQVTAAKSVVNAPDAPVAVQSHICHIAEIGMFPTQTFVFCQTPGPGGISYFIWPTGGPSADTRGAARFLNIALTAKALGKPLKFSYDDTNNSTSVPPGVGCNPASCRHPILIVLLPN